MCGRIPATSGGAEQCIGDLVPEPGVVSVQGSAIG